jgi:hypothetical protein
MIENRGFFMIFLDCGRNVIYAILNEQKIIEKRYRSELLQKRTPRSRGAVPAGYSRV